MLVYNKYFSHSLLPRVDNESLDKAELEYIH